MACPKSGKKRKRLPSINPFFHYLKCVWKQFKGCKRSAVVQYAVKKWGRMSNAEKQKYYDAACKAQRMHRKAKKCPKPKPKCPKPKPKCPKPKPKCPKPKRKPCPPPPTPSNCGQKKPTC